MMGDEAAALVSAALAARKNAYVPYSGYPVGAAVLGEDGNIFTGCNVENVSYPAGMCAERNAIGSAVTAGYTSFQGIAVAGSDKGFDALWNLPPGHSGISYPRGHCGKR